MSPPLHQQGQEVAERLLVEIVVGPVDGLCHGVSGKAGILLDQFLDNDVDVLSLFFCVFCGERSHVFHPTTAINQIDRLFILCCPAVRV